MHVVGLASVIENFNGMFVRDVFVPVGSDIKIVGGVVSMWNVLFPLNASFPCVSLHQMFQIYPPSSIVSSNVFVVADVGFEFVWFCSNVPEKFPHNIHESRSISVGVYVNIIVFDDKYVLIGEFRVIDGAPTATVNVDESEDCLLSVSFMNIFSVCNPSVMLNVVFAQDGSVVFVSSSILYQQDSMLSSASDVVKSKARDSL